MDNDIDILRGPRGERVVVVPFTQLYLEKKAQRIQHSRCAKFCMIFCGVYAAIFLMSGIMLLSFALSARDYFTNILGLISLIQFFAAGICMLPTIILCCRYHRRHQNQIQKYLHIGDSRQYRGPLPNEELPQSEELALDTFSGGHMVNRPSAPTEVPMDHLGVRMSFHPPTPPDISMGQYQHGSSGRVSPYQLQQAEHMETSPVPVHDLSYYPSPYSSSHLRQTEGRYSPSHDSPLSPGRMSPGRMSPGRMSPGRMSSERASGHFI